jgi:hypothetical protein
VDVIIDRLTRMLKLDSSVFAEIANDDNATGQAVMVSALVAAISNLFGEGNIISNLVFGLVFGAIGLFIWTGMVFVSGKLFGGKADYIRLLRPIGYAAAPFALGIVPFLGILGLAYSLVIQIRAVREVNQVGDGSAVATVILPFALVFIIAIIIVIAAGVALMAAFN